ncbi:MAG: sigma-70 family RNA polymerase sigma factor [Thermoflexales bacterium]|nr:sigma-70 family RNA polymerase sigma factor [Thermoflexales bacterium]MCS7324166.1 sigma-70 family RNA polymerase sigma factor [Thermoflexales bacterium]MCX7937830.1 sigma-70 family RNA polymerase sigma factor [Thermoflexales bacterium]MDW8053243.1 sigma-70 family RNA polymerase sigma factor [Anaerolineae bacterium]MDW8291894.1 sigma-70 family RNA polymerase sigma factor [Anaerolineae bacterium]
MSETESDLVRRAKTDREAFGLLYERYVTAIYRYVFYRVGNVQDAEDLTARVFLRALNHIHRYDERGLPFSAWLYRIAHNVVVNFHRDQRRHPSLSLEEVAEDVERHPTAATTDEDAEAVDQAFDAARARAHLLRAIRHLPEERQHLLVLKFVQGLSNAEIGAIMNRSEGAVKSLYHRTLIQLRALMEQLEREAGVSADKP